MVLIQGQMKKIKRTHKDRINMTYELNDYDKTDQQYEGLNGNWITHPNLDPKIVEKGESFLMGTKSTSPASSTPAQVAPMLDYYQLQKVKQRLIEVYSKILDEALKDLR